MAEWISKRGPNGREWVPVNDAAKIKDLKNDVQDGAAKPEELAEAKAQEVAKALKAEVEARKAEAAIVAERERVHAALFASQEKKDVVDDEKRGKVE